jgi:hypothetical protein
MLPGCASAAAPFATLALTDADAYLKPDCSSTVQKAVGSAKR